MVDDQRPRQLEGPISIGAETHTEQGVLGCEAASRERERGEMLGRRVTRVRRGG